MPSSQNRVRRLGAAAGRLFLLATVGVGVALTAFDPLAAHHTPWHDHIVLGAHGLKGWAHAVVVHRHLDEGWGALGEARAVPQFPARIAPRGRPRVLSIARVPDGAGASILDVNGQVPTGFGAIGQLVLPPRWERGLPLVAHALRPTILPAPDPPPRVSS